MHDPMTVRVQGWEPGVSRKLELRAGAVLALLLLGMGCSDPDPNSGSSGSGGSDGSGGFGGASTGGASMGGSSSTGGGSGTLQPADLYPLEVGQRRTFEIVEPAGMECDPNFETVLRTENVGGKEAFVVDHVCAPDEEIILAHHGGQLVQWNEDKWIVTMKAPLEEGLTWIATERYTFQWSFVSDITVPAGSFQDCWARESVPPSPLSRNVYCPGVGPVRRENADLIVELASFEKD